MRDERTAEKKKSFSSGTWRKVGDAHLCGTCRRPKQLVSLVILTVLWWVW